ncbi:dtdp-glucose 4,6-dehydratase [Spathaspora passalidarum NRRL Y-27907]|uniref:Dtdp-glucose 4,6-dehydratase n=1 Tax=Spathaspora passalidarum (strain NRRL Y-27907 / 11-Y1) TaxID=619300 RepID=G3AF31_SPAPN|nr:dtdp-glucose 4,6-dehydratase [Spathaspora passalidarum NRRL Y-27907]EGW34835.1 dtdp-glucose 4,6-dehydratase [Spathaspora passalidarum NRRL Y-27907]
MTIHFDKRVLITGGAGFIGSNFLSYFVRKYPNYHFTCIDKLNYASNFENIADLLQLNNFKFIKLDLSESFETLYSMLVTNFHQMEITDFINFAAESCVDRSLISPLYFTKNNILATQNVLECYRELRNKYSHQYKFNFIHISTDEVYGDINQNTDEQGTLCPTNPYAATKAAIDLIIQSYQYSYNLPITILRPNNVYGPNQYPEKIIPLTIKCLQEQSPIPIHGDGTNKRCYLYISDFLHAIDLIWHSGISTSEIYNIGGDCEIDNNSLVKLICQKVFKTNSVDHTQYIQYVKDRGYNDKEYSINNDKIRQLGWKPVVVLPEGLDMII